eukprot:1407941-Lingulodinium_polyedra.AAC.1
MSSVLPKRTVGFLKTDPKRHWSRRVRTTPGLRRTPSHSSNCSKCGRPACSSGCSPSHRAPTRPASRAASALRTASR